MIPESAADLAVRHSIVVASKREHAFRVFTDGLGTWWPVTSYADAPVGPERAVLETRIHGRWYEVRPDNSEAEVGTVRAWKAPERVVLIWSLGADYAFDAEIETEVDVRFTAIGGATRVELEHRGLDAYGDDAERMWDELDAGWPGLLQLYAARAAD